VSGKERGREGANKSKSGDGRQKERQNERKSEREGEGERERQRDVESERTRESERERVYLYTTVAKIDRRHSKPKAEGSHRDWKRSHFHLATHTLQLVPFTAFCRKDEVICVQDTTIT